MNEGIKVDDLNREWSNILSQYVAQKVILEERVKHLEAQLEELKAQLVAIKSNLVTDLTDQ